MNLRQPLEVVWHGPFEGECIQTGKTLLMLLHASSSSFCALAFLAGEFAAQDGLPSLAGRLVHVPLHPARDECGNP